LKLSKPLAILVVLTLAFAAGAILRVPAAPTGQQYDHIVIIAMENQDYSSVIGNSAAPFINSLVPLGTVIPRYHSYGAGAFAGDSISGCSAACYVAFMSGSTHGVSDAYCNSGGCLTGTTLVDQMQAAGLSWQAYCEAGCPREADHFPFFGFQSDYQSPNVFMSSSVSTSDFLAAANGANPPNLLWLTPTDQHNMHSVSVSTGDAYLQSLLVGSGTFLAPALGSLLASNLFKMRTELYLWWDEYDPSPNLQIGFGGASIKAGYSSPSTSYDEYASLQTIENNWGLSPLGNAASASVTSDIFGSNPNCGTPILTTTDVVSANTLAGGAFDPGIPDKRSTAPPCSVNGKGMWIQINNVSLSNIQNGAASQDCNPINGVTYCDSVADALSPNNSNRLHIEIDQTWKAAGIAPPDFPTDGSRINIVGFAYWDNESSGQWEMHPVASWSRASQSSGNFGSCASLPGGWNCGGTNGLLGSTVNIVGGVLETRQLNFGVGNDSSYYYASTKKGTFPWSPCQSPASGMLPTNLTDVTVDFSLLNFVPYGSYRYHVFLALYYWLPNGAVSASGSTYQCLDTQSRIENIKGAFSPIGSTATYNPGDSFGWDNVTLGPIAVGQTYTLTANVSHQCQQDLKAWGLNPNTPCQLAGIEIGTEGFQFQELDVNWYKIQFTTSLPKPLTSTFTVTPSAPQAEQPVDFAATATGGTPPYSYAWRFDDGSTVTGQNVSHTYSTPGTYTISLNVTDFAGRDAIASKTVNISPPSPPDFSVVADPSNATIGVGATGTSTITVTSVGGFTGTVGLKATVSPSNSLACALSRTNVTLGTSGTSTISCSGLPSTYMVTVNGTSGSKSHSVTMTFNVIIADFSIGASPANPTIISGRTGNSTVAITPIGSFAGTVTLAFQVSPSTGLTCSMNATTIAVTTSMTSNLSCTGYAGLYTVTIIGSDASTSHNTTVSFTVQSFTITVAPNSVTANAGAQAGSTVTVSAVNGFTGTVTLLASASPTSGVICTLTPTSITGGSGTSAISCSGTVGTYQVTVAGNNYSLSHTASAIFKFTDFTIETPAPDAVTVAQPGTSLITVRAINGFTGTITLSAQTTSTTAQLALSTTTMTLRSASSSGTVILDVTDSVAENVPVTITAMIGSLSHSASASFGFTDFTASASPVPLVIQAGQSATSTITIASVNGFSGNVSLSVSNTTKLDIDLNQSSVVLSTAAPTILPVTITVPADTAPGSYVESLNATGGPITSSATLIVQVTAPEPSNPPPSSPQKAPSACLLCSVLQAVETGWGLLVTSILVGFALGWATLSLVARVRRSEAHRIKHPQSHDNRGTNRLPRWLRRARSSQRTRGSRR